MGASVSVVTSVAESIKNNETSMKCMPLSATSCDDHNKNPDICDMIPGCDFEPSSCSHTTKTDCMNDNRCDWMKDSGTSDPSQLRYESVNGDSSTDSETGTCLTKSGSGVCTGTPNTSGQMTVNKMKVKGLKINAKGNCDVDFGIKNKQIFNCEMGQVVESISDITNESKMNKQTGWMLGISGDVNTNVTKDQINNKLNQMCGTAQQAYNTIEFEDINIDCSSKEELNNVDLGIDNNQQTDCLMSIASRMETKIGNKAESKVLNDILGGMGGWVFMVLGGLVVLYLIFRVFKLGKDDKVDVEVGKFKLNGGRGNPQSASQNPNPNPNPTVVGTKVSNP